MHVAWPLRGNSQGAGCFQGGAHAIPTELVANKLELKEVEDAKSGVSLAAHELNRDFGVHLCGNAAHPGFLKKGSGDLENLKGSWVACPERSGRIEVVLWLQRSATSMAMSGVAFAWGRNGSSTVP